MRHDAQEIVSHAMGLFQGGSLAAGLFIKLRIIDRYRGLTGETAQEALFFIAVAALVPGLKGQNADHPVLRDEGQSETGAISAAHKKRGIPVVFGTFPDVEHFRSVFEAENRVGRTALSHRFRLPYFFIDAAAGQFTQFPVG